MDIDALKATSVAIDDGEWQSDLPNLPGVELKVRSYSAPIVAKAVAKALRKAGDVSDDAREEIDRDVIAQHVLMDWRGLTQNGEPVSFTSESARELLMSGIFLAAVNVAAGRVSAANEERLAALAKNSSTPSSAKSKAA